MGVKEKEAVEVEEMFLVTYERGFPKGRSCKLTVKVAFLFVRWDFLGVLVLLATFFGPVMLHFATLLPAT